MPDHCPDHAAMCVQAADHQYTYDDSYNRSCLQNIFLLFRRVTLSCVESLPVSGPQIRTMKRVSLSARIPRLMSQLLRDEE